MAGHPLKCRRSSCGVRRLMFAGFVLIEVCLGSCGMNPLVATLAEFSTEYEVVQSITSDVYGWDDGFGFDLAIYGPYVAVGIPFYGDNAGNVRKR